MYNYPHQQMELRLAHPLRGRDGAGRATRSVCHRKTTKTKRESSQQEATTEVTGDDAVRLLQFLEQSGIEVYVDGGWGVDALLGVKTRPHRDLDIAVPHKFVPRLRKLLKARGFRDVPRNDTREMQLCFRG
jgi:hypothetical protein